MAIEKFWSNVRGLSAGVFRFNVYIADEPVPTAEEVERRLSADTRWFRKLAVIGFNREEFGGFLQEGELAELVTGVERMKAALAADDLAAGKTAFALILGVLNFYRYADLDGLRLGKLIEQTLREAGWPEELGELRFWRATRDEEFPALSIYAHLKTTVVKNLPGFLEACRRLRPKLDDIAREVAPDWFPHVTFRTDELLPEYANLPDDDQEPASHRPDVGAAQLPGAA